MSKLVIAIIRYMYNDKTIEIKYKLNVLADSQLEIVRKYKKVLPSFTTITLPTILGICATRTHAMQDTNRLIVRNGFGKLL